MKDLKHANEFLRNKKTNKNEFRPSYHLSPNFGWCNDQFLSWDLSYIFPI